MMKKFCIMLSMLGVMMVQPVLANPCDTSNGCDTDNCRTCCSKKYHYDSGFCSGDTASTVVCTCTEPLPTIIQNKCKNSCKK